MKRLFFITAMFLASVGAMKADEIVVPNIVIPKGGTAILDIQLNNEQELNRTFGFFINLPEGVTVVDKSEKLGERFNGTNVSVRGTLESDGRYKIMVINGFNVEDDYPIPENSGTIVTIELSADESIDEGTVLDASIENIELNLFSKETEGTPSDVPITADFQIIIGQPADGRVNLDETSTIVPEAATGVDVRVCRTINANEWSTICLPFSMTEAQVKATFGDDVQLGNFYDTESTYDDDDNVVGLSISFEDATEIEANHPYIIKVSSPITEFTVDNVNIEPLEDDAMIEVDNGLTGRRRVVYGGFYGTYHAQTELEEYALFLSSNKFWYSKGLTKMKAFRAYFVLLDVLTEVEAANTRISINFSDEEVNGIKTLNKLDNGCFYDLQGRKVVKPVKGLYIINGRKEVIK